MSRTCNIEVAKNICSIVIKQEITGRADGQYYIKLITNGVPFILAQ